MSHLRPPSPVPSWPVLAMIAALLGYAVFIGVNFAPIASGSDSAGYLMSARMLSEGRLTIPMRTVPEYTPTNGWAYTPLGLEQVSPAEILRPTYPVGLPLHYLAASLVFGWYWGPLAIGVLSAVGAVVACYYIAREFGVPPVLAALAAACLAISAQFLYTSFLALSDTVATAWSAFAFLAALRAKRSGWWAVGCGVAFSVTVVLRPANLILLPALMVALWRWRHLLLAGAGAVPGAAFNAVYNWRLFGNPLLSGYGENVGDLFRWEWVRPSLENYAATMPLVLPLAFFGVLLLPWMPWKTRSRELLACWLWALTFAVVYAFYEFTHDSWWFLRFLLPGFPAFAVLGACGLQGTLERFGGRWPRGLAVAVALLMALLSLRCTVHVARERHFMLLKEYQLPYLAVCEWARANLPEDAFVAAMQTSTAFYYYTDFPVMRWDAADPEPFADLKAALARTHRPFYAVLFPHEREEAMGRMPAEWHLLTEIKGVGVWRYGPAP